MIVGIINGVHLEVHLEVYVLSLVSANTSTKKRVILEAIYALDESSGNKTCRSSTLISGILT